VLSVPRQFSYSQTARYANFTLLVFPFGAFGRVRHVPDPDQVILLAIGERLLVVERTSRSEASLPHQLDSDGRNLSLHWLTSIAMLHIASCKDMAEVRG
jgi:hypothetical protein